MSINTDLTQTLAPTSSLATLNLSTPARNPVRLSGLDTQKEQLKQVATQWVGQTFAGTLLKQLRESPFATDMFSGGNGGKSFTALLDMELASRSGRGLAADLAESITRRLAEPDQNEAAKPTNNATKEDARVTLDL